MSDDYLWDRTGTPHPDELYLERLLPRVREQVRRASVPPAPPALSRRASHGLAFALGFAAALATVLGALALWRRPAPPDASIRGEPAGRRDEPTTPARPTVAPPSESAPSPVPQRTTPPLPLPARVTPSVASAETAAESRSPQDIEKVVAAHRAEVRARCWEPALAKRGDVGAPNAKLRAVFSVDRSGGVSGVDVGPSLADYPSLASCVQGEVRAWRFAPAGEATTVHVPFSFTASAE